MGMSSSVITHWINQISIFLACPLCSVILSILTTRNLHPEAFTAVMSRLKKKKRIRFLLPVTMRATGYCNIYTHMRLCWWAASAGVRVQEQQGGNKKERRDNMLAKYSTAQNVGKCYKQAHVPELKSSKDATQGGTCFRFKLGPQQEKKMYIFFSFFNFDISSIKSKFCEKKIKFRK